MLNCIQTKSKKTFGLKTLFLALGMVATLISANVTVAQAANKHAAYVIDANTGKVLYASNANARRYPASLTKMMTLYMMFESLEKRRFTTKSRVVFSKYAAAQAPSKLGIKPGRSISMKDAIYALVTKSANDVATAVGEKIGGSERNFAALMTKKARQLGMRHTVFRNASGLPNKAQYTTAKDMAILGLALREHFPRYYHVFSTRMFKFGKRRYGNHNKLLGRVKGVDGIKTGYTRASGFNLVTSVGVGNRRIVAVVMGGKTGNSRNARMTKLIKKYLPKASNRRGKKRNLVAVKKSSLKVASKKQLALADMPKKAIPLPKSKPSAQPATTIAALASQPKSKPTSLTKTIEQLENQPAQPISKPSVQTKWLIQIAAVPSLKAAKSMHQKALNKAPTILASAEPFTQQVTKGNEAFYRVRFSGFNSKEEARKTCQRLKKKSIACLALHQ